MQAETEILKKHRWTYDEYLQAFNLGWFKNKRTELIEGEIVYMSVMNVSHFQGVVKCSEVLQMIFAKKGFFVSTQCPIIVGEFSSPEPDVAVIEGQPEDYKESLPKTAALVIEIADTSLTYDRTEKASLYAKANVADYWIINLKNRRLEIRRRPLPDETAVFGYSYSEIQILTDKDSVAPLAKPEAVIKISDLLP
ncbi:MAG: Uma2 family endonuclease [Pyrinomonadaceae bacterium]